ncbi:hypothetical protein [Streptomyces sp. NBC_01264]|uniref:hypothetical protein n=1 Tax=Streptomyces sp. NBC_01264 TaxID=2903804 RepID=UPI002254553F|nr:hypothetical protein [Streptomyces sp. NBC_01264]MCX4781611.1 hypothetical protein [Streptomyces sp. NBC_01264]
MSIYQEHRVGGGSCGIWSKNVLGPVWIEVPGPGRVLQVGAAGALKKGPKGPTSPPIKPWGAHSAA